MGNLINLQRFSLQINSGTTLAGAVNLVAGTNITLVQSGQNVTINSTGGGGGGATTALDNLASTAINADLVPDTADTYDLGSTTLGFRTAYLTNVQLINDGFLYLNASQSVSIQYNGVDNELEFKLPTGKSVGFLINSSTNRIIQMTETDVSIGVGVNVDLFLAGNMEISSGTLVVDDSGTFDLSNTANDTRLLVWDVTAGSLRRVTIGIANSGGAGFRLLRIPN